MNRIFLQTSLVLTFLLCGVVAFAQVTTARVAGVVTDNTGEAVIGATVVAIHTPSGTQYGTTSRVDGKYDLPNLRVGGPYTIQASFVGYETQKQEGLQLQLAQKRTLNFVLTTGSVDLAEVTVLAKSDDILNNERTGASTNVSTEVIEKLPSISRSTQDYYRLTPSASGNSFGGRNNKMNNFTLDGSIFNNPFGLDAATPGSQSGAQPVSLDAIEQVQVNIAPYDVTQAGFTGAAVNAVTKSGTNELTGTVFGFWRNQDLTGGKVRGQDIHVPDLTHLQTGFSVGGAIIKDKLFFFANAEIERRGDAGSNFLAARPGLEGSQVSRVLAEDLDRVSEALAGIGYETGAYENYTHRTDNQKGLLKLDWNINKNHTLTATYNFLDATRDKNAHPEALGRRGPDFTTLQFFNSGYAINNKLHSGIVEVKSIFGNKFSNFFQAGITSFRDSRDPFSSPAPVMNINKDGVRYIVAGHEPFSVSNRLNQDVYQVTNNLNIYQGDHTITVGTSFEKFTFDNSFNLGTYDPFTGYPGGTFGPGFESVDAFIDSVNSGAVLAAIEVAEEVYETNGGADGELGKGWALAETNVGQWALYVQDEWAASDKLTVTAGVRMDMPLYFDTSDKIQENIDRQPAYVPDVEYYDVDGNPLMFDHTVLPKQTPLFSPRLGFNYDVKGDNTTRLRGGTGLFSGRFPFVWVGNQVANPNVFFYCMTDPEFQFPQVWRSNLGLDKSLGNGFTATVDVVYTKDVNAMMVRNYGLKKPSGTLQGGIGERPIYLYDADRNSFGNDAYVFTNTDVGETFNASVQLQRKWNNGLFTSIAYDYLDSKDASSIPAEISGDAFARNPAFGNVNEAALAYSRYGHNHRVVGAAHKRFEYGRMATTVAVFFEYVRGGRFSYTYSGDINGDGSGLNDLIYIPTEAEMNQIEFADASQADVQRAAMNAFIEQDEYLSANRGSFAEKYAVLSPWFSTWDLRVAQDIMVGEKNSVQITMDILNVGNLVSSEWGVRQLATNTQPIGVVAYEANSEGVLQPITPKYSFDPTQKTTFTDDFSLLSRWQMQLGLRYRF